jgi:lysophospholipase
LLSQIDDDFGPGMKAGPPRLGDRFLMPRDFVWGIFQTPDGAQLRWGHLPVAKPRAHFVLVSGFGDFIEKQFETVRDLTDRGFAVWCLDWRGQGRSTRPARSGTFESSQ